MDYDLATGPRNRVHVHTSNRAALDLQFWLELDSAVDVNADGRTLKASRGIGFGTRDDDSTDLDRDTSVE